MNLDIRLIALIIPLSFAACSNNFYYPAELRKPRDEVKLRKIGYGGDSMIPHNDSFILLDGLAFIGHKHINEVKYTYEPSLPQIQQRLDSIRSRSKSSKYKFSLWGYTFLGNDTLQNKSNLANRLRTQVVGAWTNYAGNGFVAANCMATRYIYDHSLLPKTVIYRIDGTIPVEEQMQKYITLSKLNLKSVSLNWVPTDSTLFINIKTRLLKN